MFTTFAHAESEKKSIKQIVSSAKSKLSKIKSKSIIKVPGFSLMNLVANEKEQTAKLHNPIKNSCYFKISIILDDGTVIWTSDLIAPGDKVEHITLSKTLSEGTYENVTVKYDCFALNKKTSFNNAKIKIRLIVEKREEDIK